MLGTIISLSDSAAIQGLILRIPHFHQVYGIILILILTLKQKTFIKSPGKDDEYPITLAFDEAVFKVTITLKANYQVDLTKSNFYELIGFDKKVLTASSNVGANVPNLSNYQLY